MTTRSGMAGSIGFAQEDDYAVPKTPTLWLPHLSESLEAVHEPIESESTYYGARLPRSGQYAEGNFMAGGDLGFEFTDKGAGLFLLNMFGNVVTTSLGGGLYQHVFTFGELTGKSVTTQVVRPDSATGALEPFTYAGGKFTAWEVGVKVKELATIGLTLAAKHEITYRTVADGVTVSASAAITSATAQWSTSDEGKPISGAGIPVGATILTVESSTNATLSANATASAAGVTFAIGVPRATPSYASNIYPMSGASASQTLGGASYRAKAWTIKCAAGLDDERFFLGDRGRDESLEADLHGVTGQVDSEFFDISTYRRFLRNEEVPLVLKLRRGQSTAVFTMNVRFTGKTPNLDGKKIVQQALPYKVYGTDNDAAGITATLVNTDATP